MFNSFHIQTSAIRSDHFFLVLIQGTNQNYYVRALKEMFPVFTVENVQTRHKGLKCCGYIGYNRATRYKHKMDANVVQQKAVECTVENVHF